MTESQSNLAEVQSQLQKVQCDFKESEENVEILKKAIEERDAKHRNCVRFLATM